MGPLPHRGYGEPRYRRPVEVEVRWTAFWSRAVRDAVIRDAVALDMHFVLL
jgi:hypothetical protein